MSIDHLVRESVAALDEDNSVQQAVDLMASQNVGSLVVTRKGKVVGLFTERDLVKRVVAKNRDVKSVRLGEVATMSGLVTASHEMSCQEAVQKMRSHDCRRLLVYRGDHFLGLVSLPNVAYALAEQTGGKNLLANVLVGIALLVAVSVIAMLVYLLPGMIEVAGQATGT